MSGSAAVGPRPRTVALLRAGPHRAARVTALAPRPRDAAPGRAGPGGAAGRERPLADAGVGGGGIGFTVDGAGWDSGGGSY
ncbi:hypothetical protein ABT040_03455 [Streptomyces sp. NPDC002688]|uniref:hypothetical protein n=1 Tax=Streptomyces sp. NPDC002688 TaxID=3154423 RepID=UPI003331B408